MAQICPAGLYLSTIMAIDYLQTIVAIPCGTLKYYVEGDILILKNS